MPEGEIKRMNINVEAGLHSAFKAATAAKDAAREALLVLMRPLAMYVQVTANNDLAALLSSGFSAAAIATSAPERAAHSVPWPGIWVASSAGCTH